MPRLSYPGQRRPTPRKPQQADVAPAFTTDTADRTWRGLPPECDEAAPSMVEALMYSLRERVFESL